MIKATIIDKKDVVDILCDSFLENLSINYILKNGSEKGKEVRALMEYSFDMCMLFGEVFLSENRKACALIMLPHLKNDNLQSMLLDVKLIFKCTGIGNIMKVLNREKIIKSKHPTYPFYYLWFIGVKKNEQYNGVGSQLLREVIESAKSKKLPVLLETSTETNIAWYEKFDFKEYTTVDLGYRLHFFSNN